ncbi:MAG: hypothetical protein WEG36_01125 [Gemmatimonadota bacterium]
MHPFTHYEHLATLFDYPRRDYPSWVQATYDLLAGRYVVGAAHLDAFAKLLPTEGGPFTPEALDEVQEIFTRSFDVQPITTLSVGYLVFGDDYKRGELLANLNREGRALGIDFGSELPDHLPNVLRLLARWEDRDLAGELVTEVFHPALRQMIEEFDQRRISGRDELYRKHFGTLIVTSTERGTMFRHPLESVLAVLETDFKVSSDASSPAPSHDFLNGIARELEIEPSDQPSYALGEAP